MFCFDGFERRRAVEECPRLMVQRASRLMRGGGSEKFFFLTGRKLRVLWLAVWRQDDEHWLVDLEWCGRRVARRQVVRLDSTRPAIGGERWWWQCPGGIWGPEFHRDELSACRRRVERLYLRSGRWACRTCHELTYLSCRNSRRKRTWGLD
ncbi:MAG: hypothetical protein SGJ19_20260 [Planctomycetia bacterium]|nr:hypothetical protein [Planctomycetia bacterium]